MPGKKKTPGFEEEMERLEEIAEEMEAGDAPLERLCALFDEGMKLSESLKKKLEAASCRLKIVTEEDGEAKLTDSPLLDSEIPDAQTDDEGEEEDD